MNTKMICEIIEIIIESILFTFFLFHRMTPRRLTHPAKMMIFFTLFSALITFLCYRASLDTVLSQIIIFTFRLILVSFCFTDRFSNKAFHNCLPCFMSIFADQMTLFVLFMAEYFKWFRWPWLRFIYDNIIVSTSLYLIFEFLILFVFLFVLRDLSRLSKNLFGFFVIITAMALLVSTYFLSRVINVDPYLLPNAEYQLTFNCISIFILILFLSTLMINQVTNRTFNENMELAEQLHIQEKNEERNKTFLQSAENLHKWKHDYTNHLATMKGLLEKGSYDQLSEYITEQLECLPQTFPTVDTGHPVIDAILMNKYAMAGAADIAFEYSVILPDNIPLNDIELTGVLGNLLDNALEACRDEALQSTSPIIEFVIKPKRGMLYIGVTNNSAGNYIYKNDGTLETTKEEKETHGKGLASVIQIIRSHAGLWHINAEPEYFSL